MDNIARPWFPPASNAKATKTFAPGERVIPVTDQFAVPAAVPPFDPLHGLHIQVTCVTPVLSDAVPLTLRIELVVL